MWLCDLEKALKIIREKIGHLGLVIERVEDSFGNIVFIFSNDEYWVYVPNTEEIIEYRKGNKNSGN